MIAVVLSIVPVAVFIAAGWLIHRFGVLNTEVWAGINRLVYFVLLPALLLKTMATVDATGSEVVSTAIGVLLPMTAMTAILIMVRRKIARDGPAFSSVLQGALRVNAYIGLAVADSVMGPIGLSAFTLVLAFVIPLDNVISIVGLVRYAGSTKVRRSQVLRAVVLNPLIVSTVFGMVLGRLDIKMPDVMEEVLGLAGGAALPLALLATGAGLKFVDTPVDYRTGIIACVVRQVGMPFLVLASATLIGVEPLTRWALMLYGSLATGPAAYIAARQLGGDAPLMAMIVSLTTLAAFVSVPFWLALVS